MKNACFLLLFFFISVLTVAAQDSTHVQQAPVKAIPVAPSAWYNTQKVNPLGYNYYNSLGAACKAELKLEKATSIPFRFRLGSLAQTDYMEQKPHAAKPEHP